MQSSLDELDSVTRAIRPTTLIRSARLDELAEAEILIASETFQHTGSFKFRAAYCAAVNSPAQTLIAASSGNFGQALAYASSLLGKRAIIVMPHNSASVKVEAVKSFGGTVELVDVKVKTRASRVAELSAQYPDAEVLSAFDHDHVIAGNSTLGNEIAQRASDFDYVIAPMGGGGLVCGLILGLKRSGVAMPVYGAEPLLANDAKRSLVAGHIIANETEPQTIADGARTLSLGQRNWKILKDGVADILEVSDDAIKDGVRSLFKLANLKAEPTGAVAVAACLGNKELFRGKRVVCVVSGGNVDTDVYMRILKGDD